MAGVTEFVPCSSLSFGLRAGILYQFEQTGWVPYVDPPWLLPLAGRFDSEEDIAQ